jgi:cbb3-type cytochrome oxidase subunit 3
VSPGIVSLLAVTFGFSALVVWVYWPSRKAAMERHASIPLADEPEAPAPQKEQSK